jgi:hypothetical protein
MRPPVLLVAIGGLLAACGPGVVAPPPEAPAPETTVGPGADEPVPAGERLEHRLVLVRWGAPLRYAPAEGGPALRDEAWSSKTALGAATPFRLVRVRGDYLEIESLPSGDDAQHCALPSPSFRGLALRFFVKKEDLALVLQKWQGVEFRDGTALRLQPGVQIGARDPRPALRGMEHHLVEIDGLRLLAAVLPERLGWSYVPPPPLARAPAARVVRDDARPILGGQPALAGLEPRRELAVESTIDMGGGKSLATLHLPCAELQAVVTTSDLVPRKAPAAAASRAAPATWVRAGAPVQWSNLRDAGTVVEAVRTGAEVARQGAYRCFRQPLVAPWPAIAGQPPTFDLCFAAADVSVSETAPPPRPRAAGLLNVEVVAGQPATVMQALVALSGVGHHPDASVEYRALLPRGAEPDWLARYRDLVVAEGALPFSPHRACAYDAEDYRAFDACVAIVSSEADRATIQAAFLGTSRLLEGKGRLGHAPPAAERRALADLLNGTRADAMVAVLKARASLAAADVLPTRLVLVSSHANEGETEGRYLVVHSDANVELDAAAAFHELAHAAFRGGAHAATWTAFADHGYAGVIALGRVDEAFATALHAGLAIPWIPLPGAARPLWYANPSIDALARALHDEWRRDESIHAGPSLAAAMLRAVEKGWPRERWTTADLLNFVRLYARDRAPLDAFAARLAPAMARRTYPVPRALIDEPLAIPRVFFLTEAESDARPDLMGPLGTTREELHGQLQRASAALHWADDAHGIPIVVVVGRDAPALLRAAAAFGEPQALPERGWTPLR